MGRMSGKVIDGRSVAESVRAEVARGVSALAVPPGLATILVGDDPASAIYVNGKRKQCVQAGITDLHQHLPGDVSQAELASVIEVANHDLRVTGILLQLPLPKHLDAAELINRISPEKDVDGLTAINAGRLSRGGSGLRPCTPSGVMELLRAYDVEVEGAQAVVIGRSSLVGLPLSMMLLQQNATVTVCHSRTRDLPSVCRRADILVAAAGVPRLVRADAVRAGATVIDVGIHRTADGLCGDVDYVGVRAAAGAITPVPGGVGPMTIAMLLRNTLLAASL